ncbi:hypothetical protein LINPERPRIM_LOCUS37291 [Linum perenne]
MMPTTTTTVLPERARSSDHLVEELVPSSSWDEDNHSYFLLVNLPDSFIHGLIGWLVM